VSRLRLANLLGQITFGLQAMTLCLPSMQQWGQIFGADQTTVQLTFSAYVIA
jgi:MFS transporter, DHA1 family, multidrug resistance protein